MNNADDGRHAGVCMHLLKYKCTQQNLWSVCEPVWPSGKGVRLVSGRTLVRYRFGSPFSSKRLWFVDTVL